MTLEVSILMFLISSTKKSPIRCNLNINDEIILFMSHSKLNIFVTFEITSYDFFML